MTIGILNLCVKTVNCHLLPNDAMHTCYAHASRVHSQIKYVSM